MLSPLRQICPRTFWLAGLWRGAVCLPERHVARVDLDSLPAEFDITGALARESGFLGVVDLLKVAKHGAGENIYLIRFHYVPPRARKPSPRKPG